jgi:hypothetical protein
VIPQIGALCHCLARGTKFIRDGTATIVSRMR